MEKVIVTGAAGFIGHHLCKALVACGHDVLGCGSPVRLVDFIYTLEDALERRAELEY